MEIYNIIQLNKGELLLRQVSYVVWCLGIAFILMGIIIEIPIYPFYWILAIITLSGISAVSLTVLGYLLFKIGFKSIWPHFATILSFTSGITMALSAIVYMRGRILEFSSLFLLGNPILSHVLFPALFSMAFGMTLRKSMDFEYLGLAFLLASILPFLFVGGIGLIPIGALLFYFGYINRKTLGGG